MKKVFAYVCLINGIYDLILGLFAFVAPATLGTIIGAPIDVYLIANLQVIGACLIGFAIGLFAAFRNLDSLLIVPLIKIVAHILAAGSLIYHALVSTLSIYIIFLAGTDLIFGILYVLFFLIIKDYGFTNPLKAGKQ